MGGGPSNYQARFGYATGYGGFNPRRHGNVAVSGILPRKVKILVSLSVEIFFLWDNAYALL